MPVYGVRLGLENGADAEYRAELERAMDDAWRGKFSVLIVWALDRIVREGPEDALRIFREFSERGCVILSVRESWLNGSPEVQGLMISIAGWMAQQESRRRSERTRAGMARAKAEGKRIGGRKPGARDLRPRQTAGCRRRYAREG
jgi:putative DNA-invertase from lambdoid prophage Rac